ncbi:nuclease-related domain-containing protein [Streptomyces sp. NPDC059009]|uniref:nuclease-related domain-containing protein n=1 Tax=Streptomyces sp. NPDC059009 TaxID=3346694 RepID=UPI00367B9F14
MSAPAPAPWQTAGASARQRARELRQAELAEQHRRARVWALPSLVLAYLGYSTADLVFTPTLSLAAALAIPVLLMRRIYEPSPQVRRWQLGAAGEQRTARILTSLTRQHWVVLHDRRVPDSRANLDHIALVPDGMGAVYVDTKTTRGGGRVSVRGGVLRIGRSSYKNALSTVEWEAAQASKALGVPVSPVIAIQGATVPRHGIATGSGLTIVAANRLPQTLRQIRHQHEPNVLAALTARAEAVLPRYTA